MSTNSNSVKAYTKRVGSRWNTDDAVVVAAVSVPIRPGHVAQLTLGITAYNVTTNTSMAATKLVAYQATPAGVITLLGAAVDVYQAGAAWPVTLVIVQPTALLEGKVEVRVQGVAANLISWQVAVDILEGGPMAANTGWIG